MAPKKMAFGRLDLLRNDKLPKGKKIRIDGYLEEFSLSREEANQLIMAAREIVFK